MGKVYYISCDIEAARGWQLYSVTADSEEEAIKKYHSGEAEFIEEEVDVENMGEPYISGEETPKCEKYRLI